MSGQMDVPSYLFMLRDPGTRDVNMEAASPLEYHDAPPLTPPNDIDSAPEDVSTGANETIALKPGETLVVYHPHSQCPRRVIPSAALHTCYPESRPRSHDPCRRITKALLLLWARRP
jgi:hypothetical protein